MPVVHLTDLAIQRLKPRDAQVTYYDKSLPAFGLRVGRRSKTFVVVLGKDRKRVSLGKYPGTKLQDARKKAGELIFAPAPSDAPKAGPRAEDAVRDFLDKRKVKARTAHEYERILESYLLEKHRDRTIDCITTADILEITDALLDTPAEAIHAHAAIKTFFNWALERRLIDRSPLAGLKLPAKPAQRERVLSDDELKAVHRAADKLGHPFGLIVLICIHTGMRRSEVGALRWSYIAPEHITLPAEMTKNGVQHALPNLINHVFARVPRQGEYLFPSSVGTPFSAWSKSKGAFDKLSDVNDWVLHDLRRTFSTKMAEWQIAEPHVVERILNHISGTSLSPLAKIYNRHSYAAQMKAAMKRYDAKLTELLQTD